MNIYAITDMQFCCIVSSFHKSRCTCINVRPTVDYAFVQQAKLIVTRPTHFLTDEANLSFLTVVIKNFILVFSVTQMILGVCNQLELTTNLHIHISGSLVSKETLFLFMKKNPIYLLGNNL